MTRVLNGCILYFMNNAAPKRTASEIKLHNLGQDLEAAIERANRSGKAGDIMRVRAIREEMRDVRMGR